MDEDSKLKLTPLQLETLVDYILKESASYLDTENIHSEKQGSSDDTCTMIM